MAEQSPQTPPPAKPPPPVPPAEATADAEQTRSDAAKLALTLLLLYIIFHEDEEADQPSTLTKIDAATREMVKLIVLGYWKATWGRDISPPSGPELEQIIEEVVPKVRQIAETISPAVDSPDEARLAAESLATAAYNAVALQLAEGDHSLAATLTLYKTWVTRADGRVRPLHRRLHGATKPIDADFWRWPATGQQLAFPGDPRAPLDATIGCRCLLLVSTVLAPEIPPMPPEKGADSDAEG